MTITLFPIIAAIIGLILWILPLPKKAQEAGMILFAVGVFWIVAGNAHASQFTVK